MDVRACIGIEDEKPHSWLDPDSSSCAERWEVWLRRLDLNFPVPHVPESADSEVPVGRERQELRQFFAERELLE